MNHTLVNATSNKTKKRKFLERRFPSQKLYIALAQVMLQSFIVHMYKI